MLCSKPFRLGVSEFGCGQCMPCRLNRRRLWTARIMLESQLHSASSFVTLTYDEDHLPDDRSVSVRHVQLFLKRVRDYVYPAKVRYFIVGEYGDLTLRPHYHAILFGVDDNALVSKCWTLGNVHSGTLTEQSAAYVVSYTVKRMTSVDDVRLRGRKPEFARMSLKPGIGAGAVGTIADVMTSKVGSDYVSKQGDVVSVIRTDGKVYPLGRYIRGQLRNASGVDNPDKLSYQIKLRNEVYTKEGREAREQKRLQVSRRARVLNQISRSKKGVGL